MSANDPLVTARITNLPQVTTTLNMIADGLTTEALDPFLKELTAFVDQKFGERMHEKTGLMKATRKAEQVKPGHWQAYATVPYAIHEVRRPGSKGALGPHDFLTPTANEAINKLKTELPNAVITFVNRTTGKTRVMIL